MNVILVKPVVVYLTHHAVRGRLIFIAVRKRLSEPELEPRAVKYNVMIADASNLPMLHVNALNLRISLDEFYITLGVVQPPDQIDLSEAAGVLNAVAQPVFRFAVSRATMEQFLSVMVGQSEQQSKLVQLVNSSSEKTIKEELNRDE